MKKDDAGGWLQGNGNTMVWKTDYLDAHPPTSNPSSGCTSSVTPLACVIGPAKPKPWRLARVGAGGCTAAAHGGDCNCGHYLIDKHSDTAMGNSTGFLYNAAIDREIDYDSAEWAVIDLWSIGK